MDVDMEVSPSYFSPDDLSSRERFRRYRKMQSNSSTGRHHDSPSPRFSNAALEIEQFDMDFGVTPIEPVYRRRGSLDRQDSGGVRGLILWGYNVRSESLKICKQEQHDQSENADSTFSLFASLLDSAFQGLMPIPDLILRFESSCRSVSESIRNSYCLRETI